MLGARNGGGAELEKYERFLEFAEQLFLINSFSNRFVILLATLNYSPKTMI